ncbi:MAG: hypothetical protein LBK61_01390 [Spirochaetaceae bacterium]|jgi:hypothetical protein|nr:hypothetical protein [Spirochaetaceae bacterium]
MFDLIKNKKIWNNKNSVEEIDYSILLAHIFGEPVATEKAFMYFFRRYGLPNGLHDSYKDLCVYSFRTRDRGIIVRWCLGVGNYHHHLCAFANRKDYYDYSFRPVDEWHRQIQEAAERDGLVYFGGDAPWSIYDRTKAGKTVWAGNEIQKTAQREICKDYSNEDEDAWDKVFERMRQNDKEIQDKYEAVLPFPKIESQYGKPFCCQFDNQIEAGKQQHDWIMSLPESHFLRRVYFAVTELFEDWKRQTYIRDVYFNLTCAEDPNPKGKTVKYTDYTVALAESRKEG